VSWYDWRMTTGSWLERCSYPISVQAFLLYMYQTNTRSSSLADLLWLRLFLSGRTWELCEKLKITAGGWHDRGLIPWVYNLTTYLHWNRAQKIPLFLAIVTLVEFRVRKFPWAVHITKTPTNSHHLTGNQWYVAICNIYGQHSPRRFIRAILYLQLSFFLQSVCVGLGYTYFGQKILLLSNYCWEPTGWYIPAAAIPSSADIRYKAHVFGSRNEAIKPLQNIIIFRVFVVKGFFTIPGACYNTAQYVYYWVASY